ncbi:SDR family NAD(P)-dependent oxidoreductase [Dongia deserti]|uniref:SDR family NAD(P)-dependent oxidoreductase n=1 Tax=Dongia deserti TaxID=2268030 RepID=UPI000E646FF8|nr:SDR family NAD(P)-dependent oxidoreductase [Dongia deserti]
MTEFAGKTILVTGSTRGIGAAAARLFLERGGSVILHGRRQADVDAAVARLSTTYSGRVRGLSADLSDRTACRALAASIETLDVLVNCGGIFHEAAIAETSPTLWDETVAVNLTAPWVLAQSLLPKLRASRGAIVNVASDAALLGYAGCVAYCASKGALVGLTRALATELTPDVRVLCVCPGPTETDMMRASISVAPDRDKARQQWASYTLLNRVASPVEIGEAILLAASPRASYLTGSLIMADGGATAGKRV